MAGSIQHGQQEQSPVYGTPEIPAKFRPYLLSEPIIGALVAIEQFEKWGADDSAGEAQSEDEQQDRRDEAEYRWVVRVNVGRSDRLLPGMLLFDADGDCFDVSSVDEHTCTAVLESTPVARRRVPNPTVGMCMATTTKVFTQRPQSAPAR